MEGLTSIERDCIERAMAADMLPQVEVLVGR